MNDLIQFPDDSGGASGQPPADPEIRAADDADAATPEETCSRRVYDELHDRHARLQADFDNFRKRLERERKAYQATAVEHLVVDILPVLDHLELALRHARESGSGDPIVEGVDMVYRQFLGILDRHGLKRIETAGRPFDPHVHEAITQVEKPGLADGMVADEFQGGYLLGTKVIRPARVSVNRGGDGVPPAIPEEGADGPGDRD
jgi:molecular chaperone GrpE